MDLLGRADSEGYAAVVALAGGQRDPVNADRVPVAAGDFDGIEEAVVAFTLGLGALTGVVALVELLDGRGQAG